MNTPIDSSHKNLHLGLLFHLANQFKDLLIGHYFADSGITAPQFKVLINIFKGNTSPAEICKSLQMDTGAMSRMVARMVKNDLVERRPNPHDKRQVILALTAKGQTLCNTFQNDLRPLLREHRRCLRQRKSGHPDTANHRYRDSGDRG
ncbi:MarR family transcriptional regulator [Klebsiella variicola]|uniref:MarR family transcriptional regulator n=1 Tax=Klebsiella variicola TaxID=244366 RepID=UPI002B053AA4|nr:MarR family transcriptional regulator [Klebsiella variicola]